MYLIDTHAHLYLPEFDHDRDDVLRRALDNNIRKIFLPNIDTETLTPMLSLCDRYPDILYPMAGLHPTSVDASFTNALNKIKPLLDEGRVIAIGETGIDLYWDTSRKQEQIRAFSLQVEWSLEYNLPLVIHSRESFEEIFSVLRSYAQSGLTGVFHSFTGNREQAQEAISMGFKLGIGGIVTFKNSELKNVIKDVDPVHILVETDAPYLAPVPHRGKRNESAFVADTANFLAALYGIPQEDFAALTTENALTLFIKARDHE